ncbi:MAG: hypothetical protein ACLRI7_00610 [Ruthenibacterium lactatiformans]
MQYFYQVKNRIGQYGVYCFNAGVAFAGCRQVYFDFGLSAGWIDYQFVLAFQVILNTSAQGKPVFSARQPSFPSGDCVIDARGRTGWR